MSSVKCYQVPLKTAVKEIFYVKYQALCRWQSIEKIYIADVF